MSTTMTPQAFVAKWRRASATERAASQSHFNDLCDLLGQPKPLEADPAGRWFTFEAGASKATGGEGWADVWKMGHFAWEYKGQHANLDKAYAQLLQYGAPTTCFETFPFPWPPGQEPAGDPRVDAIAGAARAQVASRDAWLNPAGAGEAELKKRTLTALYNSRPTWLDLAHRKLDAAVLDAYGWPHDLGDEEILARLLALNGERSKGQIP